VRTGNTRLIPPVSLGCAIQNLEPKGHEFRNKAIWYPDTRLQRHENESRFITFQSESCVQTAGAVGPGTLCSAASLPWSPGPCSPTIFRSAICECLSLNGFFSRERPYGPGQSITPRLLGPFPPFFQIVINKRIFLSPGTRFTGERSNTFPPTARPTVCP